MIAQAQQTLDPPMQLRVLIFVWRTHQEKDSLTFFTLVSINTFVKTWPNELPNMAYGSQSGLSLA
jgi:hypothetical protein